MHSIGMEPFRATRLWNGLIKEFRSGMHPKRHRWRMRYYENCFTSSEAIEFLLNHLHNDANFGPWVTRDQSLRLLTKFIENHVIAEVKSSTSKGPFEDDGRLYRLCPFSPIKKLRSALNSRTNLRELTEASPKKRPKSDNAKKIPSTTPTSSLRAPLFPKTTSDDVNEQDFVRRPSARLRLCKVVTRSIGKAELQDIWKSSALTRLQRITGVSTIEDFVRVDEIQAIDIIQNSLHISRNNIVIIEDKSKDLPHWVLSAMRCLAHWPDRTDESGLPSYPGFERDVFKTVSNYFHSQPQPLLTYNLYDIITGSFLICDRRDRGLEDSPCDLTTPPSVAASNRLNSFGSVENLMLDMTMGWTPLTKFSGQSSDGLNRAGRERRSMQRRSHVMPMSRPNRSQSPTGGKGNDCHSSGTIFCLTSQKITTPGESSLDEDCRDPCDDLECRESETSQTSHPKNRPQSAPAGGYSHICPVTYAPPSNGIDDYGFLPVVRDQYFSPSKQVGDHAKRYSSDSDLISSRSAVGFEPSRHVYDQSAGDGRPQRQLHYASTSCLNISQKASPDLQESSFEFTRSSRSGSFKNRRKFSSLTNIDIKPDDEKRKKPTKSTSNLSISRRFGSASEIIQKFFTKKSEKTKSKWYVNSHESVPDLKARRTSCNVKLQRWNSTDGNAEPSSVADNRSPPYPSPLRATVSQPTLVGKHNDSGSSLNAFQPALVGEHNDSAGLCNKRNNSGPSLDQTGFVRKRNTSGSSLDQTGLVRKRNTSCSSLDQTGLVRKRNTSGSSLNASKPTLAARRNHSGASFDSYKPVLVRKRNDSGTSLNQSTLSSRRRNTSGSSLDSFKPVLGGKRNVSGSSLDSFHSARSNLTRQTTSSSSMKWSTPDEDQSKHSISSTSVCLTDDQSYTVEGLKMCCLLLPPPNRKKLHLLLKLMAKMVNNKQLNLSKHMSTKSLVLQTFWRSILSCEVEVGLDEILAIKVVTYMMEHYDQIMTVSEELKSDVEERTLYLRRSQVKYNGTEDVENIPVTFCQKISTDEYKQQKLSYSENAISTLLEDIINNKTMPVKVKKKKLKKFQQEYPEIYAKRLPTTTHEAELFPQKPKIKQPMLNMKRSLNKLKSIR